jgi:hypothetical protein
VKCLSLAGGFYLAEFLPAPPADPVDVGCHGVQVAWRQHGPAHGRHGAGESCTPMRVTSRIPARLPSVYAHVLSVSGRTIAEPAPSRAWQPTQMEVTPRPWKTLSPRAACRR